MNDDEPGITRRRRGRGFQYTGPTGRPLGKRSLERVKALVIPPAWTDVWICATADGHIQATGRDARGRKQYRYHERWTEVRDETKYDRTVDFGRVLPRLRRRVAKDMARRKLSKPKVLATIVHLLDTTAIRVGNDEYARENDSFGLTTIEDRHVKVSGGRVVFRFRGKGGKLHEVEERDARVARVIRRLDDLPGQQLFQYLDAAGEPHDVTSDDVNEYLRDATGGDFTAKDFRTWTGTVLSAWALDEQGEHRTAAEVRRQQAAAVREVAAELGNTPAVCRRCYIHPGVLEAHANGTLDPALHDRRRKRGLTSREAAALHVLEANHA